MINLSMFEAFGQFDSKLAYEAMNEADKRYLAIRDSNAQRSFRPSAAVEAAEREMVAYADTWIQWRHEERMAEIRADIATFENDLETVENVDREPIRTYRCRCGCGCTRMHMHPGTSYYTDCEAGDCPGNCIGCDKLTNLSDSGRCGSCERAHQADVGDQGDGECHACGEYALLNKHGACRGCEIDAHNEQLVR